MNTAEDRVKIPKMELIPREEREQQEIRYMGYAEKPRFREGKSYGK